MKYCLIQFGCQMNQADAERIKTVLNKVGYEETQEEDEAELLGIVACSVRQKSIDRVYSKIQRWNHRKKTENIITFVTGCVLPRDRKQFLKLFDLVFPVTELKNLPEMIADYGIVTPLSVNYAQQKRVDISKETLDDFWQITPNYSSRFEAFIPIQNGCDKFCTFCAVPYTRGREISRSSDDILKQVRTLVEDGYKSITLLGQNVNSYGSDKSGEERTFAQLLDEIGKIGQELEQEFWVYFTAPHPKDMGIDVLETMVKYPHLAKQIHLPLQSADDKVLERMNRRHTLQDFREIVENIRTLMPQATLFTDIIVGFTDETEEEFEQTRLAMEEFSFNMAFIAIYSPRPGAVSFRWKDDIAQMEKKRRFHVLSEILQQTAVEANETMINTTQRVLIDKLDEGKKVLMGKTEGKVIVRILSDDASLVGSFQDVMIHRRSSLSLEGELLSSVSENIEVVNV